jgi:delta24-sterol reductase
LGPLGWTTAIIPELDDLTVGGLIAGFGVEGSSHKYGLFQHICVSYEVVLPNGDLIKCSATEHPELFYTIPWSYGTLGFLVAAEIKIVPARKYIHLKYEPCYSKEQYVELVTKYAREKKVDFIEALVYSKETAVVMTGYMTDHPESHKINSISRFYKPWFYQHVRDFLKFGPGDEYIPSSDYYHRHTKSLFWEMADILSFGNHPVFRYLLGWLIPPKVSFLKLFTVQRVHEQFKNHHVDQDMLVPIKDLSTCIDVFHQDWEIYPLWVCPCAIPKTPIRGLINPRADEEMFVDVGAYGVPKAPGYQAELRHRSVEKWVRDVKGFQALYAATYQTQQELETMFDHSVYYKLRKQYGCEGSMPVIYDKVGRHVRGL